MARSVLETIIKVVKQGGGDQETIKGLADLKKSVGDVMNIMGGLVAAGAAVYAAFKNTAGVFIDYAAQVRDLSRLTGMSAEQTSRLIQVADDAKVSYESLQKALWFAAKNGVEPNIESISRLADEYVSLHDPVKQADLLNKNFGKGGAEMGKLLELGSEGIKNLNAGIEKNMVLTDAAVASARAWEIQQDQFNDKVEATKVAVGQDLIGAMTGATQEINRFALANYKAATGITANGRAMSYLKEGEDAAWDAARKMAEQQYVLAHSTAEATNSSLMLSEAARDSANAQLENADAMQVAAEQAQALADQQKQVMDVAFQLQSALDSYEDTMRDVNETQKQAQDTWVQAQADYEKGIITKKELTAAEEKYSETMAQTGEQANAAAAKHQDAMNRIVFSILQAQAAADGLSAEEGKALLQIAVKLNMVDKETADLATEMVNDFGNIADGVRSANGTMYKFNEAVWVAGTQTGDYYYNFFIKTVGNVPGFAGMGAEELVTTVGSGGHLIGNYASGGQWGGEWATVGERGLEILSPSGYIIPHDASMHLLAAGFTPGASFAMGGDLDDRSGGSTGAPIPIRKKTNSTSTGTSTSTSTSTTTSTRAASSAVVAASQQVTQASMENAQTTRQSNEAMINVTTEAMSSARLANETMLAEMKGLRQDIQKMQDTTVRGMREAVITMGGA